MQLHYELTEMDFRRAFAAHRNRRALTRWFWRGIYVWVIVLGIIGLAPFAVRPSRETFANAIPALVFLALWIAVLWGIPRWSAYRQFRKQPAAQGSRSLVLDEFGLHSEWNGGTAQNAWKNIVRYLETPELFLLYTSPACFNIVPKRGMDAEQLAGIRGLLSQHVAGSK